MLYHKVHPWLAEGRSKAWVKQIEYVKSTYSAAEIVYAGHGSAGSLDALNGQREYIQFFYQLVCDRFTSDGVSDVAKAEIKQTMQTHYPNYPLEFLIEMNIDGIVNELIDEKGATDHE